MTSKKYMNPEKNRKQTDYNGEKPDTAGPKKYTRKPKLSVSWSDNSGRHFSRAATKEEIKDYKQSLVSDRKHMEKLIKERNISRK